MSLFVTDSSGFRLMFRTGNTMSCAWGVVDTIYPNEAATAIDVQRIRSAWSDPVVVSEQEFALKGLPIGFTSSLVDLDRDWSHVTPTITRWIHRDLIDRIDLEGHDLFPGNENAKT